MGGTCSAQESKESRIKNQESRICVAWLSGCSEQRGTPAIKSASTDSFAHFTLSVTSQVTECDTKETGEITNYCTCAGREKRASRLAVRLFATEPSKLLTSSSNRAALGLHSTDPFLFIDLPRIEREGV